MGPCVSKDGEVKPKETTKGMPQNKDFFSEFQGDPVDFFEFSEVIGKGAFSVVKRAQDKETKQIVAVKMIPTNILLKNYEQTKREVHIMKTLGPHDNIVKLFRVVKGRKHLCIAMELLKGQELFDRICDLGHYDEQTARLVSKQLLEAVAFLHAHAIAHRDLKPENAIFAVRDDDSSLKVTDFGFANIYSPDTRFVATCGTPLYVAPEIIEMVPYDLQCDMWSLGVIVYILLCGFPPFYGEDNEELYYRIQRADYEFISPQWDPVSMTAKDFVAKLLELDPHKRLTASQALAHPWIANAGQKGPRLNNAVLELKRTQCKRKFIRGIEAVIAMNRIQRGTTRDN